MRILKYKYSTVLKQIFTNLKKYEKLTNFHTNFTNQKKRILEQCLPLLLLLLLSILILIINNINTYIVIIIIK